MQSTLTIHRLTTITLHTSWTLLDPYKKVLLATTDQLQMYKVHLTTLPDIRVQILLKDIHSQLTEIHIVIPHFKMKKLI